MANIPVGAIVGGVGAATVLLTLLALGLHMWHRKRVRDAAAQYRVDQFKLSPPPQQSHYYPSPINTSPSRPTSAPSSPTDTKRGGRFQHLLPVIREMNGIPPLPITQGRRAADVHGQLAAPTSRNDEPPAYTAG